MGEVITSTASVTRIEDHVRRALRAARALGGDVAQAAEARVAPAVAAIDAAVALQNAAQETEAVAWAAVLAEDAKSDTGIGQLRDMMWNALGRPRQSPFLDQVFPGGVGTYTSGDPRQQPVLMQVLGSRIATASAPQWTKAMCDGWVAELAALRSSYATAVEAHRPAEAAATVADVGYRSSVRTAQARLVAFKRDLHNLGLTEQQIHEIIPDASSASAAAPPKPPTPAPVGPGGGGGPVTGGGAIPTGNPPAST
jgi:hypothetical protein